VQKVDGPILAIYMSYDFAQGVAFAGRNDCTCVKIFIGVNFLIEINSVMR